MKTRLPLLLTAALLSFASARADEGTTTTATFSDPSKPGTFAAHLSNGEITIRGDDVDTVTVKSDARGGQTGKPRSDGLRVIGSSASFALEERNNVITLDYGDGNWTDSAEFLVIVPRNTHIDLEVSLGGEVSINHISGDITIKNLNGEISLNDISGGAIVESMNGEISASFATLTPDKPLSFTSMNGEISLRLPADAAANVRFRTQNGAILTDFDESVLITKTTAGRAFAPEVSEEFAQAAADIAREAVEMARQVADEVRTAVAESRSKRDRSTPVAIPVPAAAPRAPKAPRAPNIPAMAGGKVISGTLNGGGVDLQIATMNGDIVVRKLP